MAIFLQNGESVEDPLDRFHLRLNEVMAFDGSDTKQYLLDVSLTAAYIFIKGCF